MTDSSFIRLLDTVRANAPGAMDGNVRLELFQVVNEFLQRSDIWHEEVELTTSNQSFFYEMPFFMNGGQINRLMWLEGQRPPQTSTFQRGTPRRGYLERTGSQAILKIDFLPANAEVWRAHFAMSVVDPTDNNGLPILPVWIVSKYFDGLTSGVLFRLMMQPSKPYSNPKLADLHGRKFEEAKSLAKKEARAGFTFDGQRWTFPQTFRSGSQRMWR